MSLADDLKNVTLKIVENRIFAKYNLPYKYPQYNGICKAFVNDELCVSFE